MNDKDAIVIGIITFLIGIFIALWYKEYIVFRLPSGKKELVIINNVIEKKSIPLYFFKDNRWSHENSEIIMSTDIQDNSVRIVNAWLQLLEEEGAAKKRISVESVIVTQSGKDAYISFDRNPFEKASSTFEKWYFIEALLKTIKASDVSIERIYFQVHYQPLSDYHLDFNNPWPIDGFLKESVNIDN